MPEIGNKIDIDLIDETFDISQSENYNLSVQIGQDGLTFCVLNTVINKYVCLRNYPISSTDMSGTISECKMIFERDDLLGLRYKRSKLLLISPRFTFVPDNFYDDNNKDFYLTFNHGAATGEQTLQNHVKSANFYNIFSYPEELLALLKKYQPDINLFHHATPIVDTFITGRSHSTEASAYFYCGHLDIIIAKNNRLLYYNTFSIDAPEDSVYYLIVTSNLFDIDLKTTKLIYPGNYEQMPSEIAILNNYVECIVECESPTAVTYSHYISKVYRKRFINLFNLYGCE